mgnify:CR=1 FL=1
MKTTPKSPDATAKLLCILGQETGAKLLKHLPDDSLQEVMMKVAQQGPIDSCEKKRLLTEFHEDLAKRRVGSEGGQDVVKNLLQKGLPSHEAQGQWMALQRKLNDRPFSKVAKCDPSTLFTLLREEAPQTIAIVMAHLKPEKSGALLELFPPKTQVAITRAICRIHQANRESVEALDAVLEERLFNWSKGKTVDIGGIDFAAKLLNQTEMSTSKGILENVEEEDVDLGAELRKALFTFDDILMVSDADFQKVLREYETDEMVLSLRGATEELQEKFFSNLSPRKSDMLKEEMDYLGPVLRSEVDASQQRLIDVVRRMEEQGEIVVDRNHGLI